jgi:hypothetical protein
MNYRQVTRLKRRKWTYSAPPRVAMMATKWTL